MPTRLDFVDAVIDGQRLLNVWREEHGTGPRLLPSGRWRTSFDGGVFYDMGSANRFGDTSVSISTTCHGPLLVHVHYHPENRLDTYTFHLSDDPEELRARLFLAFEDASGTTP